MLSCMQDSAHDSQHIYRVLYIALDIASHEEGVDFDVLIAACLLHDIGRQEEFRDPALCHAAVGAAKAYAFLTTEGWFPAAFAQRVAGCIRAHRFRSGSPPARIEEKILFDADKLDVTGCTGIARSLLYIGQVGTPLYSLDAAGAVSDGSRDEQPSFFPRIPLQAQKALFPVLYRAGPGTGQGAAISGGFFLPVAAPGSLFRLPVWPAGSAALSAIRSSCVPSYNLILNGGFSYDPSCHSIHPHPFV